MLSYLYAGVLGGQPIFQYGHDDIYTEMHDQVMPTVWDWKILNEGAPAMGALLLHVFKLIGILTCDFSPQEEKGVKKITWKNSKIIRLQCK